MCDQVEIKFSTRRLELEDDDDYHDRKDSPGRHKVAAKLMPLCIDAVYRFLVHTWVLGSKHRVYVVHDCPLRLKVVQL